MFPTCYVGVIVERCVPICYRCVNDTCDTGSDERIQVRRTLLIAAAVIIPLKKVLCFSPHHSVCLCVCVCLSVCHHVCGEMAGLSNMASSEVNTI